MTDFAGTQLGKYTVDQKIAVGGMAEIYRAHGRNGEPVAIKVIHPRLAAEARFVQMFLDEAKIVVNLKHGNIVQLFDFGKIANTYYFSMEWIDGRPLAAIIQRALELNIAVPVEVVLVVAIDILKGLHYAHTRCDRFQRPLGIVHRDVSPPNILVTRAGLSKIADFGIADAQHKVVQTRPGIIRGKFSYMSPEQSRGTEVDARSDVFSVGIILHEILSGRRLFLRNFEVETIEAVRQCEIPPLFPSRPDVPEAIERMIRKALAPLPDRRYPSAIEFATDLWFEAKKLDPEISHKTLSQFMKVLFPWETFVGADEPLKVLLLRFKDRNRHALGRGRSIPWIQVADRLTRHPHLPHLWIALAALLAAEILARIA